MLESVIGNTVVFGQFEWDEEKSKANIKKHGISFEEATAAFEDPLFIQLYDAAHSSHGEERMKGIGVMKGLLVTATVFTERERKRIISARKADKKEEALYYERNYGGKDD